MNEHKFQAKKFRVSADEKIKLANISTCAGKELSDKELAVEALNQDLASLADSQSRLYAEGKRSLLVILQGMDASGKDGTIRHVMNGVNPQGCRVYSFKAPSGEDLEHHFLWRPMRFLPEKGMITIFNRSYYEEVLAVRVHPEFLAPQKIEPVKDLEKLWEQRFEEIRTFEEFVSNQGTTVLKFYLHISKEEQKKRLLERLNTPEKLWKFNERDLDERKLWNEYRNAFEQMLPATSTKKAPWFIIPADDKWYARAAIADIISSRLDNMEVEYPAVSDANRAHFAELAKKLEEEK